MPGPRTKTNSRDVIRSRSALRKSLEYDNCESVLYSGQSLDALSDEVTDINLFAEITLHHQIVLTRRGIDFRDLVDLCRRVSNAIRFPKVAFHHDEYRLHGLTIPKSICANPRRTCKERWHIVGNAKF